MKKILIVSLVLSAGVLVSACNGLKEEQAKGEIVQKATSEKLDKIIEEKAVVKENVVVPEGETPSEAVEVVPTAEGTTPVVEEGSTEKPEEAPMEL